MITEGHSTLLCTVEQGDSEFKVAYMKIQSSHLSGDQISTRILFTNIFNLHSSLNYLYTKSAKQVRLSFYIS